MKKQSFLTTYNPNCQQIPKVPNMNENKNKSGASVICTSQSKGKFLKMYTRSDSLKCPSNVLFVLKDKRYGKSQKTT